MLGIGNLNHFSSSLRIKTGKWLQFRKTGYVHTVDTEKTWSENP